jgi:hypothetical protein
MRPRHNQQRDLFETDRTLVEFPVAQKRELVRLIGCLLNEAATVCEAEAPANGLRMKGAAHEQDHT